MNRRSALKWMSATLSAACASIIALPGVRYLFATVQRDDNNLAEPVQRVARLTDLPVNTPVEASITGRRQDAWSIYPEEVVGRVWLVRRTDEETPNADALVDCYSALCPHLRCAVQADKAQGCFVCPCHRGKFDLEGQRMSQDGQKNPANRGLDSLTCRIVEEDEDAWVEVTWQEFEPAITDKVAMS